MLGIRTFKIVRRVPGRTCRVAVVALGVGLLVGCSTSQLAAPEATKPVRETKESPPADKPQPDPVAQESRPPPPEKDSPKEPPRLAATVSEEPPATRPTASVAKAETTSQPAQTPKKPGKVKKKPAKAKQKVGCGDATPEEEEAARRASTAEKDEPPATKAQPRWACDKKIVTVDPVWAGKPAKFVFTIRNEGTAVLRIKARGG